MVDKQITGLGCYSRGGEDEANHTRIFAAMTDGGPDEKKDKKVRIAVCNTTSPRHIFLDLDCQMHPPHLIFKTGLQVTDRWLKSVGRKWKYFSGMAKLAHTLRDVHRQVFIRWRDLHGPPAAITNAMGACMYLFG